MTLDELASQPDARIDAALGAALIAKDVYPSVDPLALLARFDELSAPLFRLGLEKKDALEQARLVGEHVYERLGFRGNEADYYDPRNSLLSDVLERKLGIPITLALVYCEIARRVGVPARGVAFPGHFLVRVDRHLSGLGEESPPFVVVDPFFSGRIIDDESIERLLRRALGPAAEVEVGAHLAPASARHLLVRMLTNLKAIYTTRGDHARAHLAADRILLFMPNDAATLRERGALAARLGAIESARADLERALALEPDAREARATKKELDALAQKRRSLN
jgi:regulator of sirC expression with transglutaminase-like and TPR domain